MTSFSANLADRTLNTSAVFWSRESSDEPSASLDGRATREIEEILAHAAGSGTRLIMSTHNMGQARRLADEVIFVLRGRIHEFGPADEFFAGPQTAQARAFLNGDIVE